MYLRAALDQFFEGKEEKQEIRQRVKFQKITKKGKLECDKPILSKPHPKATPCTLFRESTHRIDHKSSKP